MHFVDWERKREYSTSGTTYFRSLLYTPHVCFTPCSCLFVFSSFKFTLHWFQRITHAFNETTNDLIKLGIRRVQLNSYFFSNWGKNTWIARTPNLWAKKKLKKSNYVIRQLWIFDFYECLLYELQNVYLIDSLYNLLAVCYFC